MRDSDLIADNFEEEEKVYYLFGHDIRKITCFRSTMITSLSAGLAMTLGSFLFTSDGFKSTRLGLLTTSIIMTPIWMYCAQQDLRDATMIKEAQDRIKKRTAEEYTMLDSLESMGSDSYG